eukprot:CAMPEP_0181094428 /NCGR_PEP_ID=MMETSP1071-20121207/9988_1 /TAXON_ID=35127 /ORGANISM="Thalassiosira sp., Strain NH16" /LENGTH=582 /DNA_ID=CAMNT_0023176757 /DNA_START=101 /DNA_END=1849 /DNA_ORIENTATION=+
MALTTNNTRAGKRSRSMMTRSTSSSVVVLATVLSIASSGGSVASAFVAPSATPSLSSPTIKTMAGSVSRLSAKKDSTEDNTEDENDGSLFSRLFPSSVSSLNDPTQKSQLERNVATLCTTLGFSALFLTNPLLPHLPYSNHFASAHAEDELYAKYGDKGLDTSLVDKDCLVNKCAVQAKACLQDDPDCRKGLTCTAKCMGDNACITGCFARYGDANLDGLLKCTIEDNECIKVAILEGGADAYGSEPAGPAPTVRGFDLASMEGRWYKVAGYNPNYDCYACQRNTFSAPEGGLVDRANGLLGAALGNVGADRLQVDVEFSMPRMLPDGSPPPPSGMREVLGGEGAGLQSVGLNAYSTHETMVFDKESVMDSLKLGKGSEEKLYSRTAHSEGEMFGLKFWENWYIIGQNDPGQDEFKFIYYNGKTRQNTYDGAFVYSRNKDLSPASMERVYKIAKDAGMNPDQFCKIQNGCFDGADDIKQQPSYVEREGLGSPSNPFRGILASTKVSQILGVESVAAESIIPTSVPSTTIADDYAGQQQVVAGGDRPWWKEVGDYLEDPHRHFQLMDSLRVDMDWPEYIKARN